ncbi:bifunctional tetrahydrofolate synthase/dihydrofolate synthase [Gallaecimonas sp. GXIMD4217]|uniref:bifunctional tetrahydrofolate synthase/dihydrofolate synthase n=1 Tax=Gallaecimonas sp. GXIMD4217 TaxID=3131927 RepID=UPI00311B07EA
MTEHHDASQSLADWLFRIETLHGTDIELGLTRVRQVAERLGLLPLDSRVLLVGGTNGKGSTCAMMEQILLAAGHDVAVFSSPHLIRYTERLRLNSEELPAAEHCQAFEAVEAARGDISLTYFEFSTLAALWLCRRHKPDVVILEVGLGGRLDATNIVDADVAVVTSIDIDHQAFLGDCREGIAREKAGICRPGRPLICGEPDAPASLAETARDVGAKLLQVGRDFSYRLDGEQWGFSGARERRALPLPSLPLANAATALAALDALGIALPDDAVSLGLAKAGLPGRLQVWQEKPLVLLDVAHNPHAARYLNARLRTKKGQGRVIAVCAMLADKDMAGTLSELDCIDRWLLAELPSTPRAAKAGELAALLPPDDVAGCFASVGQALEQALALASAEDVVIVFGSFYTVADVLAAKGD